MKVKTFKTWEKGVLWALFLAAILLPLFLKTGTSGTFHFLSSISILLGVSLLLQAKAEQPSGKTPPPESMYPSSSIPNDLLIGSMAMNQGADITLMEKMFDYRSEQVADETGYYLQETHPPTNSAVPAMCKQSLTGR